MIGMILGLVLLLVLIWAAQRLIAAFGIAEPIATVIWVVFVLVVVLYILNSFALVPHGLR